MDEQRRRHGIWGRVLPMLPQLVAQAAQQGGVFTRAQALGAGHSAKDVRTLTRVAGE